MTQEEIDAMRETTVKWNGLAQQLRGVEDAIVVLSTKNPRTRISSHIVKSSSDVAETKLSPKTAAALITALQGDADRIRRKMATLSTQKEPF